MTKNFIMMSGLPRSGSSVLGSMLNQHPEIYASTTSPVTDMVMILNENWQTISAALANRHPDQYSNMIAGLIDGAYQHISKTTVVDKNRLWPRNTALMNSVLKKKPKIICTVRSIPEILASYILLINKNKDKISFIDQDLIDSNILVNNKNRCKLLWEKYINHPYTSLRMGINANNADMIFLDYDKIVNHSQNTMDTLCEFIGIEHYKVKLDEMQPMPENDNYHGGLNGLHDVRSIMQRTSPPPEEIIGKELTKLYTDMKLDFWTKI